MSLAWVCRRLVWHLLYVLVEGCLPQTVSQQMSLLLDVGVLQCSVDDPLVRSACMIKITSWIGLVHPDSLVKGLTPLRAPNRLYDERH